MHTVRPYYNFKKGGYDHDKMIACKLVHTCPTCAPPRLAKRRSEIQSKAATAIENGSFVIYGVMTLPKRGNQDLEYAYGRLRTQCEKFRRSMKTIEVKYGIRESTRTFEEKYDEETFWHPHANFAWYFTGTHTPELQKAFSEEALGVWLHCAESSGIRGTSPSAQRFQLFNTLDSARRLGEYMTKHAYYPLSSPERSSNGSLKPLEPWHILELARTGNPRWVSLWWEYERVMKGTSRVQHFKNKTS
jgi:hypothetical protein